jgi:hypothetical protein
MDAYAFDNSKRSFLSVLFYVFCSGSFLLLTGCHHDDKDKTTDDTSPPPQSISEPIKAPEPTPVPEPALPPAIPVSVDEYGNQKPGESRDLPNFVPPAAQPEVKAAPATAPAAAMPSNDARDSKGRYHILQKGETLYGLARQYNVKAKKIIEMNQFNDPNRLAVGTKVYIPD